MTLLVLISISGCDENSQSLLEISRERQCRANMNTLCTDQANYCDAVGHWAGTNEELDQYARRTRSLTCPVTEELYIIELKDDGYEIRCPGGHGSIDTGCRSWTGGEGT
jgi:hypothetical protein